MCRNAAIAAAALLIVGAPMASFGSTWPDAPVPAHMHLTTVDNRIVFNGMDMRASVFESPQHSDDIVAFYRRAWGDRVVVNKVGGQQVIGHREGDYFITVEVSDVGGGSKGKLGIVNLASASHHVELGKGFAKPDGTKVFNDIAYPDDPVPARTIAMGNELSVDQNGQYFREHLLAEGWKPADDNRCTEAACLLNYERGSSKLSLVIAPGSNVHSQIVLNVQDPQGVTP